MSITLKDCTFTRPNVQPGPGEPYFTLVGRDPHAGAAVRAWAHERERLIADRKAPESDREKVAEARLIATEMDDYYVRLRLEGYSLSHQKVIRSLMASKNWTLEGAEMQANAILAEVAKINPDWDKP